MRYTEEEIDPTTENRCEISLQLNKDGDDRQEKFSFLNRNIWIFMIIIKSKWMHVFVFEPIRLLWLY